MKKELSSFKIPIRSSKVPAQPSYDFSLAQKLETTKRYKYESKGINLPPDSIYPEFSRDICFVCRLFIGDVWTHDAWDEDTLPWWSEPDDIRKSKFQHHRVWDFPADLQELNCVLCRMLAHGFKQSTQFLAATGPDPKYDDYIYIVRDFGDKNKLFEIAAVDSVPHIQFEFNVPTQFSEGKVDPHYLDAYCKEHGLDDATPEDPGGEYSLLEYSGDTSIAAQIKEWMKACAESHEDCKRSNFPLPSRVIDVGDTAYDAPRLYISNGQEAEPYVALSYCWGKEKSDVLTEERLTDFKKVIPNSALPATVFDAIQMTRRLSLRYLWVDALCIIQDSKEDWEKEAAEMRQVYQGALLSFAGLESHSKAAGLFRDRTVRVTQTPFFDGERHLVIQRQRKVDLNTTVLRKRAWTLQEQILSPATVYFSGSSIVWECHTCAIDEDGQDHNFLPHLKWFGDFPDDIGPHRLWYRLVQDYTARSITYTSDRVAAIAGLAEKCEAEEWQLGSYIVGLWAGDLPAALLWKGSTREKTDNLFSAYRNEELAEASFSWDLPSWSWLGNPDWIGWPDSFFREETPASTLYPCTIETSKTYLSTDSKVANKDIKGSLYLVGYLQPLTDTLIQAVSAHDAPPYNELSFETLKYLANSGVWRPSRPYDPSFMQPWVDIGLDIGWKALVQPVYLLRICSWPASRQARGADIGGGEYDSGYKLSEDYLDTYFLVLQAVDEDTDHGTWRYDYDEKHYWDSFDEEFNEDTVPEYQDQVDEYVERHGEWRRKALEERERLRLARLKEMMPEGLSDRGEKIEIPGVLVPEGNEDIDENDNTEEGDATEKEAEGDHEDGNEGELRKRRKPNRSPKVDDKEESSTAENEHVVVPQVQALRSQTSIATSKETSEVAEQDERGTPDANEVEGRETAAELREGEDGMPTHFRRVGVFGFRHFKEDDSFMRDATGREVTLI